MGILNLGRRLFKKEEPASILSESEINKPDAPPVFDIKKWQLDNTIAIKGSNPHVLEIVPTLKNTKNIGANWLIKFHRDQYSEHGEDGIIAKIFEVLKPENKWVCEFGAHDPEVISNTWRLINKEGWNAVLLEADDWYFGKLNNYYRENPSVCCIHTMVGYEGENTLDVILQKTPAPRNLDFMVIDIDGNDYHVWQTIEHYAAKVVMIEFNASIPVETSFIQEKKQNLNQGTSLKAMTELAAKKGYKLIAVTSWNAFFVKEEFYSLFFASEPKLEDMYVFPAKHPITMRPFQLYDGTIVIAPWNEMLWHRIDLKPNDYQMLPESLRFFSREIYNQGKIFEIDGTRISAHDENNAFLQNIFSMPGNTLAKFANNYYSQYGEDGILEKLIALIPCNNKYFIDIGAWDGVKNSRSRYLAEKFKWSGLLVEHNQKIRNELARNYSEMPEVKIAFDVNPENALADIEMTLMGNEVSNDVDVMFINVFGMEYYVWESIKKYRPNIILAQFNPTIPNDIKFIQPQDYAINQGCSLRALTDLARTKDYKLVATTLETAFFVRTKYYDVIREKTGVNSDDLDNIFSPAEMTVFQLYDGTLILRGLNRLMWNGIRIDEEKIQVVPKGIRKFHQFADKEYKQHYYRI